MPWPMARLSRGKRFSNGRRIALAPSQLSTGRGFDDRLLQIRHSYLRDYTTPDIFTSSLLQADFETFAPLILIQLLHSKSCIFYTVYRSQNT